MFSNYTYYLYLLLVVVLYRFAPARYRPHLLALSGLGFYIFHAGTATILLVALTAVTWVILFWGVAPSASGPSPIQKWRPYLAIVLPALALGVFKYSRLFVGTIGLPTASLPTPPLAISFFVFEFIHVAAEVAKGTVAYISPVQYSSFVGFFPTMIAGPIKRYSQFQSYFEAPSADARDILEGVFRILLGLLKKLVLADNLKTLIDEVGNPKTVHNVGLLTFGIFLYGLRIWLDFAGYSDIAIGSARLFGIRVPENFLHPYLQRNITDFWRHWHISLSSWLMDYVYIPLGGSRRGLPRQLVNIMIVMAVSGLWHGAAWNFVLWGIWHGIMLCVHKLFSTYVYPRLPKSLEKSRSMAALSWLVTMFAVWFGWMLFMWPLPDVATFFSLAFRGHA